MSLWEKTLAAVCVVFAIGTVIALWSYFLIIGSILLIGACSYATVWASISLYDKWLGVIEKHQPRREQALAPISIPAPAPAHVSAPVPVTFKQMLDGGHIGEGLPIIIAPDIQLPKISTVGISGVRGSGKTVTSLHLILSYIVATGGAIRFIVTDPHMYGDTGESLAELITLLNPFFLSLEDVRTTIQPDDKKYLSLLKRVGNLPNPNPGGSDLLGWSQIMEMELERRKQGKKGSPWMLVIDEFSAVMGDKEAMKQISSVLKKTNQEARKFGIDALLIGQDWRAESVGGTSVRNTIPNFIAHNMPEQWSKLVIPSREAKQTPYLKKGEIIFQSPGQIARGMVSLAEETDIVHVLRKYFPEQGIQIQEVENDTPLILGPGFMGTQTFMGSSGKTDRLVPIQIPMVEDTKTGYALACPWPEEEVVRIKEAYAQGMTDAEIAKLVYEVTGKDIPTGRVKVREVITWLMTQALQERDISL